MIGADLEADFLIALRHHGVVQTGSEDVVTAQMSHQRRGACRVAQQQRHDRCSPGRVSKPSLMSPALKRAIIKRRCRRRAAPEGLSTISIALSAADASAGVIGLE